MNRVWQVMAAPLLLGGCIDVPHAEDLAVLEAERGMDPGFAVRPEAAVRPTDEPLDELEEAPSRAAEVPRVIVPQEGRESGCPDVSFRGFPAVDLDGERIVSQHWDDAGMYVTWRAVDAGTVVESVRIFTVLDPLDDEWHCDASAHDEARRNAGRIEARLQERSWRPMEKLAVAVAEGTRGRSETLDLPAAERPVELAVRDGSIVLRVPGVTVFTKLPLSRETMAWVHDPMAGDVHHLRPQHVFADEISGAALIEIEQDTMCWTTGRDIETTRLPPELFARVRTHPTPEEYEAAG